MLLNLQILWIFYRKYLWTSVLINFLFLFFGIDFIPAFLWKSSLLAAIYGSLKLPANRDALIFYQNLGVRSIWLFCFSFVLDTVILTLSYLIIHLLL